MPFPVCKKWPGLQCDNKKSAAEEQFFGGSSIISPE